MPTKNALMPLNIVVERGNLNLTLAAALTARDSKNRIGGRAVMARVGLLLGGATLRRDAPVCFFGPRTVDEAGRDLGVIGGTTSLELAPGRSRSALTRLATCPFNSSEELSSRSLSYLDKYGPFRFRPLRLEGA